MKYVLFSGCTGVGKTFIKERIKNILETEYSYNNIYCFDDPYVNNPFIESAYSDKKKSFQSQIFFINEFIKIHKEISRLYNLDCIILQERSLFESVLVFCKLNLIQNVFSHDEYKLCESLLSNIISWFKLPDMVINITSDTDTIIERISKRGRAFESSIDHTFVEQQTELYNQFVEYVQGEFGVPTYNFSNWKDDTNDSIRHLVHSVFK